MFTNDYERFRMCLQEFFDGSGWIAYISVHGPVYLNVRTLRCTQLPSPGSAWCLSNLGIGALYCLY